MVDRPPARRAAAPHACCCPTHGFGSFCAGGVAGHDDSGTVGDEHLVNPALTLDLDTFVSDLVAGYGPVPSYYRHMDALNRAGAGGSPGRLGRPVTVEDVTDAVLAGHWVIDVRQRPGVRRRPPRRHRQRRVRPPVRDVRRLAGAVAGRHRAAGRRPDPARLRRAPTWPASASRASAPTSSPRRRCCRRAYRRVGWEELRETDRRPVLLDVRRHDEFDSGGTCRAPSTCPLHELEHRLGELPAGEIWVLLPLRLPGRHRRQHPAARRAARRPRRRRPGTGSPSWRSRRPRRCRRLTRPATTRTRGAARLPERTSTDSACTHYQADMGPLREVTQSAQQPSTPSPASRTAAPTHRRRAAGARPRVLPSRSPARPTTTTGDGRRRHRPEGRGAGQRSSASLSS